MTRKILIKGKRIGEISIREASRLSGVPARTISGWRQSGVLHGRRSGQYVLLNKADFLKLHKKWLAYKSKYGHVRGFRVVRRKTT